MRRAAVSVLAATLFAAGCSSGKSTSPGPAATTSQAAPVPVSAASSATSPIHAGVGASQNLKFSGGTATMTVLKLVDPATPTQGKEDPGVRDVAVQLKFVNHGPATFTTGTMTTFLAFDADGQNLEEHSEWPTSAGPELDTITGVNAAAGDTQSGYVTFMVPAGAKLARLQFTPPGGSMVEWTLS